MKVAFRADASVSIGSGHVMRCLALAHALKDEGAEIRFICREYEGNLCKLIEERGFQVFRLGGIQDFLWEEDAEATASILCNWLDLDWLVVDHYAIDSRWESKLRRFARKIMVIDDLADRTHDCDLLLDQNLYENMEVRYEGLVPENCLKLLGPKYALLRPEFGEARERLRMRDGSIKRTLVFFGGSDPQNETAKALEALRLMGRTDIAVDVVVGASNPHQEKIQDLCASMPNAAFHCQTGNMAELMANADLAIGAGGSANWERCCLGLPALIAVLAENQAETTGALSSYGAIMNLGWSNSLTPEDYRSAAEKLDERTLKKMGKLGFDLVDGKGSQRVTDVLSGSKI